MVKKQHPIWPNTSNKGNLLNQGRSWPSPKRTERVFLKQGYDHKIVEEQLEKVYKLIRGDLPQKKIKNNKIQSAFH